MTDPRKLDPRRSLVLTKKLSPRGVFINIVAPSAEEARARNKYVQEWSE